MKTIIFLSIFLSELFYSTGYSQKIEWSQKEPLPKTYGAGEAVVYNKDIYFLGSSDSPTSTTPDFYRYDVSLNKWQRLANMPEAKASFAMAEVNGKIYAIGGAPTTNTNYEYNIQTDTWDTLAPMPTTRKYIDCGVAGDKIYVMCGITSSVNITNKNEVYDVATNSWAEKSPVPTLRFNPAIVTFDSLIYVIGGGNSSSNSIKTVECYNTITDTWETKKSMPVAIFKPGAVVVGRKIIVLGGQDNYGRSLSSVYIYDPDSDKWSNIASLTKINCFAGYGAIGDKIYVIGGTSSEPDWTYYSEVYEGTIITEKVSINLQNEENFFIYPNPAQNTLQIEYPGLMQKNVSYKIIDLSGKTVQKEKLIGNNIDVSKIRKGTYLLKMDVDGNQQSQKFIIE